MLGPLATVATNGTQGQIIKRFLQSAIVAPLLLAGLTQVAAAADDYNIHLKGKHHERMTWLSERCLAESDGLPLSCDLPTSAQEFDDISGPTFRQGRYWRHSRWPDDPTRQLREVWTWPKFVFTARTVCPDLVEEYGFFSGLTCASHYGNLQFLHAMASDEAETHEETLVLIEGWSRFTFRFATGRIDPEENYCAAVRANAGAAAQRLAPEGLFYCEPRVIDGERYEAWTASTLFSLHCDKMFSSTICDELDDPEQARAAAIGALLHMIQDSYSQSHAARGAYLPAGPYEARVECLPVSRFYVYGLNEDEHSDADVAPQFSATCGEGADVLDPITAGAQLLYHIERGANAEDAAIVMIMGDVMGTAR